MRTRPRTFKTYPRDVDALLAQVEANWRGWLLTRDPAWRTLALQRAAAPELSGRPPADVVGKRVGCRGERRRRPVRTATRQATCATRKRSSPGSRRWIRLRVIATVTAMPHDEYLTTLAPADEYFGPMGMSILGIENQLKHINFMLDYNYGNRESDPRRCCVAEVDRRHAQGLSARPRSADAAVLVLHDAAADG